MGRDIHAICFDVGGTLRATIKNDDRSLNTVQNLQSFVGVQSDPEVFLSMLRKREKGYRKWCKKSLIELSEADLWARFMLPDFPQDFIRENAVRLNQLWRASRNNQILPDAVETIKGLSGRGYSLGIISNTTSSVEAPQMLAENGLTDCFKTVILSAVFGRRKPHPSLFLAAARSLGIPPENCAYVGDNLSRDLVGARQAGYGEVVLINIIGYQTDEFDPDDDLQEDTITELKPDFRIGKLNELIEIYPERHAHKPKQAAPLQPENLYEAALSTMWGAGQQQSFNQTFLDARKIGFTCFELNNKVTPELYQQWDARRFYVAGVHDPCPSEHSYTELKRKDIALSSTDEKQRLTSLDGLKRTIDLARKLGARSVIIHCGTVLCDRSIDLRLRELYRQGLKGTAEYVSLSEEFSVNRASHADVYMDRMIKSLEEIIAFARGSGVALALENRTRYYDIPLPDELEKFLDLCPEDWFGFQYDVGHAYTLDKLGFVPHAEWLKRFSGRLIGVHLHDVIGLEEHLVPGTGEVDYQLITPYLADHVLRTLEINPAASLQEIACGLEVLVEAGCIHKL